MKHLISQVDDLDLLAECANAMEAYNLLKTTATDILFLDIEMPELSGIDLVRNLGDRKPIIIFTTSKKDYAIDAFELKVADYILKPIVPVRFLKAVERAREIFESTRSQFAIVEKEFLFIRDSGILKRLMIDDILFLEAMGDYVKIFTKDKFHAVHVTLKNVEGELPASKFQRVHRSYVVALKKIDKIEEGVIVIHNQPVPVADAYRSILNKRLNII